MIYTTVPNFLVVAIVQHIETESSRPPVHAEMSDGEEIASRL